MSDEPLTHAELDLAIIARRGGVDPFLHELAKRAHLGQGAAVGLLVNGMIVVGGLEQPERMAQEVDAEWSTVMARSSKPDEMSDDEWAAIDERVATQATKAVNAERVERDQFAEESEHREDGLIDPTAVPGHLGRTAVAMETYPHLTLRDANIYAPGQVGVTQVEVLRIPVDRINGWWLLRTDEQGKSAMNLWQTDPNRIDD